MMEKRQPHQLLAEFAVIVRIPVQWGEMDAYGHVNNSMFFRYFESARMEYLERCGFLHSYERDKVGAILHSTQCRFKRALFFPDTIEVGTRVIEMQGRPVHHGVPRGVAGPGCTRRGGNRRHRLV